MKSIFPFSNQIAIYIYELYSNEIFKKLLIVLFEFIYKYLKEKQNKCILNYLPTHIIASLPCNVN